MKLLVVRHAVAMDKVEYQLAARGAVKTASETGHPSGDAHRGAPGDAPGDANDDFRPLTLEGIRKMRKNARGLATLVDRPALLVTSPLSRALQTAEILQQQWLGLEILVAEDLRPSARPQALATWINQRIDGDETVAVVGHEPHLSGLVTWLMKGSLGHIVELKKGGACLLEFEHGPLAKGAGVLQWLATPGLLKNLE